MIEQLKIISGGQTGVDRAALDAAIKWGIPHGGWCPKGRLAEDGIIAAQYSLQETESSDYDERTLLNVRDSDGTLIIIQGDITQVTDGTILTKKAVEKQNKPFFILDLSHEIDILNVIDWVKAKKIKILNVAGPRESQSSRIYNNSLILLESLIARLKAENIKQEINESFSVMEKLQSKINNYYNLKDIAWFNQKMDLQPEIKKLKENASFLDDYKSDTEFEKILMSKYYQTLFELSIVDFLRKSEFNVLGKDERPKYSGQIKKGMNPSSPDILFEHNKRQYFVECVTSNFSQMERYFTILPYFQCFIKIAKIYYKKYLELKSEQRLTDNWLHHINDLYAKLNKFQQNEVCNLLKKTGQDLSSQDPKMISRIIKKWAYINQYVYCFHKDFMDKKIVSDLMSVDIIFSDGIAMVSMGTNECLDSKNQVLNGIARGLIGKLKKNYFDKNHFESQITGILAIGLSTIRDRLISPAEINITNLLEEFSKLFQKECKWDQEKIITSLDNLHCIIICTSWYNWFPKYAKEHHNASFPNGFDNAYMAVCLDDIHQIEDYLFKSHIPPEFTYHVGKNLLD
jgi:hypothetical protein